MPISPFEIAMVFFIGMGPIKILVGYLAMTHGASLAMRRRVAIITVTAAVATAIALIAGGAILLRVFHVRGDTLIVAGGLVMVAYGLRSVLEGPPHEEAHEVASDAALLYAAIYPLAVPMLLNPAGIAAAMILSVELVEFGGGYVPAAVVVLGMGLLDLIVLLIAGRYAHRVPWAAITILEKVFGTLLVAIGVQLVVFGLTQLGVVQSVLE